MKYCQKMCPKPTRRVGNMSSKCPPTDSGGGMKAFFGDGDGAINCCLAHQINAVIARSEATWQSPGYSEMSEKRTKALTNRPELMGDCHDQSADWSRNDSSFLCCKQQFPDSFVLSHPLLKNGSSPWADRSRKATCSVTGTARLPADRSYPPASSAPGRSRAGRPPPGRGRAWKVFSDPLCAGSPSPAYPGSPR